MANRAINIASPDSCCPSPQPVCAPRIHFQDRAKGTPLSGAVITLVTASPGQPPPTPSTGVTDSDGNFTGPSTSTTHFPYNLTISYMGVSYTISGLSDSTSFCNTPIYICFCQAQFEVDTVVGAVLTVEASSDDGQTLQGIGFSVTGVGTGTISYTYREITLCAVPGLLPATVTITATPPAGYLANCTTITLRCGDNQVVFLPLYYYLTCYVPSCCADIGCTGGISPADRNLAPKHLQVRFTTHGTNPVPFGVVTYFADDEGVWITLTYIGTAGGVNYWSSGCRGANGNFIGCGSGLLNGLYSRFDVRYSYSATEVLMADCIPGSPYSSGYINYSRYASGCTGSPVTAKWACPPTTGPRAGILPDSGETTGWGDVVQSGFEGSSGSPICSPVDFTSGGGGEGFDNCYYKVDIMEVPCSSVPPTPGQLGGGGDGESEAYARLSLSAGFGTTGATTYSMASGSLSQAPSLAGLAASTSSAASSGLVSLLHLAGASAVSATASGALSQAPSFVGLAAASAFASASGLSGQMQLSGSAEASSAATGLFSEVLLSGASHASTASSAVLLTATFLLGSAEADSTAAGLISEAQLSGSSAASSSAGGTLAATAFILGPAAVTSTAAGRLSGSTSLSGSGGGTSSASGRLAATDTGPTGPGGSGSGTS